MKRSTLALVAGLLLLLPGSVLLARAGWVRAKGAVGEVLIHRALAATLEDGRPRLPWSWADMHPVARLTVPRLGVERPVLSGATGNVLAFGIGHVDGTAEPGERGNCVLAGHRDSWGEFLADLRVGDSLILDVPGGRGAYRVASLSVARFDDGSLLRDRGEDRLTLVTCWPLGGWLRSPWRFVVGCERSSDPAAPSPGHSPSAALEWSRPSESRSRDGSSGSIVCWRTCPSPAPPGPGAGQYLPFRHSGTKDPGHAGSRRAPGGSSARLLRVGRVVEQNG